MAEAKRERKRGVNVWLMRIVLVLCAALLAISCFFMWRLSMMIQRMEQMMAGTSSHLEQVMRTAADVSRDVDELRGTVQDLREASGRIVPLEEVEGLVETVREIAESRSQDEGEPAGKVDREIRYLLSAIAKSGLEFERRDKTYSAWKFSLWLRGKRKVYPGTITSAEDFIAKVGTKSVLGTPYYVLVGEDERRELDDWLLEVLAECRAERSAEAQPEQRAGAPSD